MSNFKIVPLTREYARGIRDNGIDEFGNRIIEQVAKGKGPCRISLKPFRVGEERRLLFSYSPFSKSNAFNQAGPVFIHSEDVEAYQDIHRFPPEIKNDPVAFPLTLIGYDEDQMMVYTKLVKDEDVDQLIERVFNERNNVAFLHARNAEAGCFICRIDRA